MHICMYLPCFLLFNSYLNFLSLRSCCFCPPSTKSCAFLNAFQFVLQHLNLLINSTRPLTEKKKEKKKGRKIQLSCAIGAPILHHDSTL